MIYARRKKKAEISLKRAMKKWFAQVGVNGRLKSCRRSKHGYRIIWQEEGKRNVITLPECSAENVFDTWMLETWGAPVEEEIPG